MKKFSFFKSVACFLVFCVFYQDIVFAGPQVNLFQIPKINSSSPGAWLRNFLPEIPESIAAVEDQFHGNSKKMIFLVQDAHTNESCQINISRALDLILKKNKGMDCIFVEAATGDNSLSFLRPVTSPENRRLIANSFLKKGLLHGVEYLDLTQENHFKTWGVEDTELYFQSLECYQAVVSKRREALSYLDSIECSLNTLKNRYCNPALKRVDSEQKKYKKHEIQICHYLDTLIREGAARNVESGELGNLEILKNAQKMESAIDFKKAGEEKERFSADLDGEASLPKYTELSKYLKYTDLIGQINTSGLLKEIKLFEAKVFRALCYSDDEKILMRSSREVELLKKMINLTLDSSEFREYQIISKDLDITKLTGFINMKIMTLKTYYERAIFLDENLEKVRGVAEQFYLLAHQRDEAFARNALAKMWETGQNAAILICGGFHSENLKRSLREKNISYISITPRVIKETNIARYEELLLSQNKYHAESQFSLSDLAPLSVGNSFAIDRAYMAGTVIAPGNKSRDEFFLAFGKAAARLAGRRLKFTPGGIESLENRVVMSSVGPMSTSQTANPSLGAQVSNFVQKKVPVVRLGDSSGPAPLRVDWGAEVSHDLGESAIPTLGAVRALAMDDFLNEMDSPAKSKVFEETYHDQELDSDISVAEYEYKISEFLSKLEITWQYDSHAIPSHVFSGLPQKMLIEIHRDEMGMLSYSGWWESLDQKNQPIHVMVDSNSEITAVDLMMNGSDGSEKAAFFYDAKSRVFSMAMQGAGHDGQSHDHEMSTGGLMALMPDHDHGGVSVSIDSGPAVHEHSSAQAVGSSHDHSSGEDHSEHMAGAASAMGGHGHISSHRSHLDHEGDDDPTIHGHGNKFRLPPFFEPVEHHSETPEEKHENPAHEKISAETKSTSPTDLVSIDEVQPDPDPILPEKKIGTEAGDNTVLYAASAAGGAGVLAATRPGFFRKNSKKVIAALLVVFVAGILAFHSSAGFGNQNIHTKVNPSAAQKVLGLGSSLRQPVLSFSTPTKKQSLLPKPNTNPKLDFGGRGVSITWRPEEIRDRGYYTFQKNTRQESLNFVSGVLRNTIHEFRLSVRNQGDIRKISYASSGANSDYYFERSWEKIDGGKFLIRQMGQGEKKPPVVIDQPIGEKYLLLNDLKDNVDDMDANRSCGVEPLCYQVEALAGKVSFPLYAELKFHPNPGKKRSDDQKFVLDVLKLGLDSRQFRVYEKRLSVDKRVSDLLKSGDGGLLFRFETTTGQPDDLDRAKIVFGGAGEEFYQINVGRGKSGLWTITQHQGLVPERTLPLKMARQGRTIYFVIPSYIIRSHLKSSSIAYVNINVAEKLQTGPVTTPRVKFELVGPDDLSRSWIVRDSSREKKSPSENLKIPIDIGVKKDREGFVVFTPDQMRIFNQSRYWMLRVPDESSSHELRFFSKNPQGFPVGDYPVVVDRAIDGWVAVRPKTTIRGLDLDDGTTIFWGSMDEIKSAPGMQSWAGGLVVNTRSGDTKRFRAILETMDSPPNPEKIVTRKKRPDPAKVIEAIRNAEKAAKAENRKQKKKIGARLAIESPTIEFLKKIVSSFGKNSLRGKKISILSLNASSADVRSISDLQLWDDSIYGSVMHSLEGEREKNNGPKIIQLNVDGLFPENAFESYAEYFIGAMRSVQQENVYFVAEGKYKDRLIASLGAAGLILEEENLPSDVKKTAVRVRIACSKQALESGIINLPVDGFGEGEIPCAKALIKLAIAAAVVGKNRGEVPDWFLNAYQILAGKKVDKGILYTILWGIAAQKVVLKFSLRKVERVPMDRVFQFFEMRGKMVANSA